MLGSPDCGAVRDKGFQRAENSKTKRELTASKNEMYDICHCYSACVNRSAAHNQLFNLSRVPFFGRIGIMDS